MDEMKFEAALSRLEAIVAELEAGDADLDQIMALFEEGARLVKSCQAKLDVAETRVVELSRKLDQEQGEPHE